MPGSSFSADVAAIRERARQKINQGPVTESYGKNPADVIEVVNEVLATEIVCWMRYSRHAIPAPGIDRAQVSGEFTEHAEEERQHARWAAEPATRWLMEKILAEEEEHADDIADLLGA